VSEASDKPFEKASDQVVEEDSSSEGEKFIN